jgi:hypothetical protein
MSVFKNYALRKSVSYVEMSIGELKTIYTVKKDSVKLIAVQLVKSASFVSLLLIFKDSIFGVI